METAAVVLGGGGCWALLLGGGGSWALLLGGGGPFFFDGASTVAEGGALAGGALFLPSFGMGRPREGAADIAFRGGLPGTSEATPSVGSGRETRTKLAGKMPCFPSKRPSNHSSLTFRVSSMTAPAGNPKSVDSTAANAAVATASPLPYTRGKHQGSVSGWQPDWASWGMGGGRDRSTDKDHIGRA